MPAGDSLFWPSRIPQLPSRTPRDSDDISPRKDGIRANHFPPSAVARWRAHRAPRVPPDAPHLKGHISTESFPPHGPKEVPKWRLHPPIDRRRNSKAPADTLAAPPQVVRLRPTRKVELPLETHSGGSTPARCSAGFRPPSAFASPPFRAFRGPWSTAAAACTRRPGSRTPRPIADRGAALP